MSNKGMLPAGKGWSEVCFYIPLAIFHKEDGAIAGIRFWLFGNLNNRRNMVNYNLLNEPPKMEILSGCTVDIPIDEVKKHYKQYGVSRGKGETRGYYYLEGIGNIAHIRSDGVPVSDVMQAIPNKGAGNEPVSLVNWNGFVRRVGWDRSIAEYATGILDGIGNTVKANVCLRGGEQYSVKSKVTKYPEDALLLNVESTDEPVVIQNMRRLNTLFLPDSCNGVFINLPWQSCPDAFKLLHLPCTIKGKDRAFGLCCHTYPNEELSQVGYEGLKLNETFILQAPELRKVQLKMQGQADTEVVKHLMKGCYVPGVCRCEVYCAPKLQTIELIQSDGERYYTYVASLRLGGMLSLEEIKVSQRVSVLELILDDTYLALNEAVRITGNACSVLIIDASNLLKNRTTKLDVDIACDSIIVRTTPRKSSGEGERLSTVTVNAGASDRWVKVNYRKGLTKIFVD